MNYKNIIWVLAILLNWQVATQAQVKPFGKVSLEELKMTTYPKDTAAEAVVLFDVGRATVEYNGTSLKTIFRRHRRIKILTKEGYEQSNIKIYYRRVGGREKLRNVKARVHILENGTIKSFKLAKKEIVDEKIDEEIHVKKLIFPQVKVGAIVEYSYKIISDFSYNLPTWYFQEDIPILYSQITTFIPGRFFDYVKIIQNPGWIKQTKFNELKNDFFASNKVTFYRNQWIARDIPKFQEEKYMTDLSNHLAKIEFQLKRFMGNTYFDTWEKLDKSLLENSGWNKPLTQRNFGKDVINRLSTLPIGFKKAKMIYDIVKKQIGYNGEESFMTSGKLKKIYNSKEGNSADINFILMNMLKRSGFQVFPVILSTRSHDQVNKTYPILNKFNYVLALVMIEDRGYLLDATEKLAPFGLLPATCLSGEGRIVSENRLANPWIKLYQGQVLKEDIKIQFEMDSKGTIHGKVQTTDFGYSALLKRRNAKGKKQQEKNKKEDEKWEGLNVVKSTFKNLMTLENPLTTTLDVNIENQVQKAGNLMYFNPLMFWKTDKNPFKLKERLYPVDFGHKIIHNFYIKLTLPQGYKVETLPKQLALTLPFKGASYYYNAKRYDKELIVISRLSISKTLFTAKQYPYLKEFFEKMVAKQAEQIVLKKK